MRTKINHIDRYATTHKLNCAIRKDENNPCTCGLINALKENEYLKDFTEKVKQMRMAQEMYFKGRLSGDLKMAKAWEKEVDKMLAVLLAEKPSAPVPQERLL